MEEAPVTQEEAESVKETPTSEEEEKETPEQTEEETEAPEETSEPEKTDQSKDLQSALAQKEHFRKKYEDSLTKIKKLEKSDKVSPDMPAPSNPMEVVKLAKALEGYNENEVDFIVRNASDKSIDGIIDATKDEWVETAIKAKREKAEGDKKTPSPSSPSSVIGGKTEEDLEKMDNDKFAKYVKDAMKGGRAGI